MVGSERLVERRKQNGYNYFDLFRVGGLDVHMLTSLSMFENYFICK